MKNTYKEYYKAKSKPEYINPEKGTYISISGKGGPEGEAFLKAIPLLFKVSYKLRMSYKNNPPANYEKYVVAPLEGIWTTNDNKKFDNKNKKNLNFKLMIRQPSFFTRSIFNEYIKELSVENESYKEIKYENFNEGDCIQIMHIGPYVDEPITIKLMIDKLKEDGKEYIEESHHEIYLSNFLKTKPEKLKTILRYKIK